jgi:secreted protein with Ig-like and vWFA domain
MLADWLANADGAGWREPQALPADLPSPAYLLPFLHRIAQGHGPVALMAAKGLAALVPMEGHVTFGPFWGNVASGWTLQRADALTPATRPVVSAETLSALEKHAYQTTVPASDQSRHGAGATASDND